MSSQRYYFILILLLAFTVISFAIALANGVIFFNPMQLFSVLSGHSNLIQHQLIVDLRLPSAINAFTAGGLLALAGALMQVLLRNPLADPYVLGISGGASVAVLGGMLFGISAHWLTVNAFVGALLAMLLVFGLSFISKQWTPTKLLLTGVILAFGWAAIISFILIISPEHTIHGMLFWLLGSIGYKPQYSFDIICIILGLGASLLLAPSLNLLSQGPQAAQSLGVSTKKLYYFLFILSSLLTACAVTIAGTIGFVGLIIPHMVRLFGVRDHRWLLPCCLLLGGSLLVLANSLAHTLFAPQQLPVGIVTTFIGVPAFILLLVRK